MSEIKVTKENVWQYCEKVSDYQAKCRICRQKYIYVDPKFREHTKDRHPEIFKYEETCKGRQEWPWICFKYNDTSTSQCLLCRQNFQPDFQSLASHLHQKHFNEVKNYVLHAWIWKYFKKSSDFQLKCNECSGKYSMILKKNLSNHIVINHSEELRYAQETRDVVHSSISVCNSKVIEVKENMWEYYSKLPNFRARCKSQNCTFECHYISHVLLLVHIDEKHKAILEWENEHIDQKPWMYFKYSFEYISDKKILYSECLICDEFFLVDRESTTTHMLQKHSEEELRNFIDNPWMMKYFIQSDDTTEFKCTICCKNITININSVLSDHIIENHLEKLHLNISTKNKEKLDQNYTLQDFQAKCRFCNFQSCYVNTTNFTEHVKKEHEETYNHEAAHEHTYPWMYFTYFTSYYLQCRCCDKVVECIYDFLTTHLDDHSFESFLNTSFRKSGWERKYYTQSSDFEVQCNICRSKISLNIPLWYFDRHIATTHPNRLTSTQRTHDIAGPSGSQPN
ncbi:uncharacterized protein [Linepithema humile]|uniref:uncharacterized protein n=1 Tax=Linepithema humile TaxID=83485 RepID=UPI0006234F91|nr:PREDICTED: uncharacterized protein LOC105677874 [Linepithema humile]